jgi:hypothetical protein
VFGALFLWSDVYLDTFRVIENPKLKMALATDLRPRVSTRSRSFWIVLHFRQQGRSNLKPQISNYKPLRQTQVRREPPHNQRPKADPPAPGCAQSGERVSLSDLAVPARSGGPHIPSRHALSTSRPAQVGGRSIRKRVKGRIM